MDTLDSTAAEVLRFWFRGESRDKRWFDKDPGFDREIRQRFLPLYAAAAAGEHAGWVDSPGNCLALILVLDQFPRNMFRAGMKDAARAFATDPLALSAAKEAIERGYDRAMLPEEKLFMYLPFQHSEVLADQARACELCRPLEGFPQTFDVYRYALAHREIIARFGRFPHRNEILGRASTPEEVEFLKRPGSSF
jgi:uncharacterized protein (DUF924 family)